MSITFNLRGHNMYMYGDKFILQKDIQGVPKGTKVALHVINNGIYYLYTIDNKNIISLDQFEMVDANIIKKFITEYPKKYLGNLDDLMLEPLTQESCKLLKRGDLVIFIAKDKSDERFKYGHVYEFRDNFRDSCGVIADDTGRENGWLYEYFSLYQKQPLNTTNIVKETNICQHKNKHIVPMLFKSFWYCPDCKKDLGDA